MVKEYEFSPCVGCGFCCTKAPCTFGERGDKGICKFLYWNEEKQMYRCQLIERKSTIANALSAGIGCTSNLNTWRRDVRERF